MINAATKNLINAKVKGPIPSKLHLKIGAAAPQIILAIISAMIADLVVVSLGMESGSIEF